MSSKGPSLWRLGDHTIKPVSRWTDTPSWEAPDRFRVQKDMLYAFGDIHGDLEKLDELLDRLPLEKQDDRLVFLGDYIDRGPDSSGVIDRLIGLRENFDCIFLLGNHESMFLDFLGWTDDAYFWGEGFLRHGGDRTLASYGVLCSDAALMADFRLPTTHESFLLDLSLSHVEPGYFLFTPVLESRRCVPGI